MTRFFARHLEHRSGGRTTACIYNRSQIPLTCVSLKKIHKIKWKNSKVQLPKLEITVFIDYVCVSGAVYRVTDATIPQASSVWKGADKKQFKYVLTQHGSEKVIEWQGSPLSLSSLTALTSLCNLDTNKLFLLQDEQFIYNPEVLGFFLKNIWL